LLNSFPYYSFREKQVLVTQYPACLSLPACQGLARQTGKSDGGQGWDETFVLVAADRIDR